MTGYVNPRELMEEPLSIDEIVPCGDGHRERVEKLAARFSEIMPYEVAMTYLHVYGIIDRMATVKSNVPFFAEKNAAQTLEIMMQEQCNLD